MKLSHALLGALALPMTLAAQGSTNPPPDPLTTMFRQTTLTFQRNLAQAFDSIPESKFGYKPTPAQLTIGYIAQHLASDNYFFCNNFGTMKATISAKDSATADSVKAKWPKDELVAKLKESFKFCEDAFAQLHDSNLTDQLTMGTRTRPRASMVFGHAMDMADHYSQIANYMRLNNLTPPTALPRPGRGGN